MYKMNLYQNLDRLNALIKVYYFFKFFKFILFLDIFYFTNKNLLDLKIELSKINSKSLILNTKILKKIFVFNIYKFCSTKTLVIFLFDFKDFLHVINLLDLKPFYFSYLKSFSSIITMKYWINLKITRSHQLLIIGLIIFKIIMYIIILILYILYTLIKFLIC